MPFIVPSVQSPLSYALSQAPNIIEGYQNRQNAIEDRATSKTNDKRNLYNTLVAHATSQGREAMDSLSGTPMFQQLANEIGQSSTLYQSPTEQYNEKVAKQNLSSAQQPGYQTPTQAQVENTVTQTNKIKQDIEDSKNKGKLFTYDDATKMGDYAHRHGASFKMESQGNGMFSVTTEMPSQSQENALNARPSAPAPVVDPMIAIQNAINAENKDIANKVNLINEPNKIGATPRTENERWRAIIGVYGGATVNPHNSALAATMTGINDYIQRNNDTPEHRQVAISQLNKRWQSYVDNGNYTDAQDLSDSMSGLGLPLPTKVITSTTKEVVQPKLNIQERRYLKAEKKSDLAKFLGKPLSKQTVSKKTVVPSTKYGIQINLPKSK